MSKLKEIYEQSKEKLGFNDTEMMMFLASVIDNTKNTEKSKKQEYVCNCAKVQNK